MTRIQRLEGIASVVGDVLLWLVLVCIGALVTVAVKDFEARESERLQRVHADGMGAGAALCTKKPS